MGAIAKLISNQEEFEERIVNRMGFLYEDFKTIALVSKCGFEHLVLNQAGIGYKLGLTESMVIQRIYAIARKEII